MAVPSVVLSSDRLPTRERLPRYLAPVPRRIEDLGLRLVWVVVAANLVGTAFGFYYYRGQFAAEPLVAWPVVPDSPVATTFVALAFASWALGRRPRYLAALGVLGSLKLGAWTPYVLVVFADGFSYLHPAMYHFLFWSHVGMVVQALVLYRVATFDGRAIGVAVGWYLLNDLVDYFVPIVGSPHHTRIPAELTATGFDHTLPAHDLAAAGAVTLTVVGTALLLSIRIARLRREVTPD